MNAYIIRQFTLNWEHTTNSSFHQAIYRHAIFSVILNSKVLIIWLFIYVAFFNYEFINLSDSFVLIDFFFYL